MSKTDKTSRTAKTLRRAHPVVLTLYEGQEILDVAGPASVFNEANNQAGYQHYAMHYLCLAADGRVTTSAGLQMCGAPLRSMPRNPHTLLVPGAADVPLQQALVDTGLISTIRRLGQRCERLASVCSGTFLLAEAGLIQGRRVTTHWAGIQQLQARFPDLRVTTDGLYSRDGRTWSSAGVLAGVDMALAMVQEDLGAEVALNVARNLVVYLVRNGDQSQFSSALNLQVQGQDPRLTNLVGWLQNNLQHNLAVDDMAAEVAVSGRSLHRMCRNAFGKTPGRLLTDMRLDRARELLQCSGRPLKQLAAECGFATPSALSKAFTQKFGISPNRYRWQFQTDGP